MGTGSTILSLRRLALALMATLAALMLLVPVAPVRAATPENEQVKLTASDGQADDEFGLAVAISGDTAVVGAYCSPNGDCDGAAYVYVRSAGSWSQQAKLAPSDAQASEQFGIAVAIDGNTIVVGADRGIVAGFVRGSAYVFVRTGTTWSEEAKLVASDGGLNDAFGGAVAIDADTAVVGAVADDDGAGNSGSAYVFFRTGASWSQQAKLNEATPVGNAQFGISVSIDGETALVGTKRGHVDGINQGSAYAFVRTGSIWAEEAKLIASDGASND